MDEDMQHAFAKGALLPKPGETQAELLVGEKVYDLLSNAAFQTSWDSLYSSCAWSTVFQCRQFVSTWYNTYREEYLPILVQYVQEGKLKGLLAMALPLSSMKGPSSLSAKGRIVGAGQYEAEYQCWLAEESCAERFIKEALLKIKVAFPGCDIHFRFLPSQVPLGWVEQDPFWKKRLVLESYSRPLMDMSTPDFNKLLRKSEYRNKLNRLKRLGNLRFEHVKDRQYFSTFLPELTTQYDFRQGAMFNKNRFRENPLKGAFLLALFDQDLLHVTLLKTNEEIIAAIVAVAGQDWVYLGGINIHAPFKAHYYSPGFVHFLMLGQYLAETGIAVFDLTPGGDAYKERIATDHDQVYELMFPRNRIHRLKKQLKKYFHDQLTKAGKRPMSVELDLRKRKYLLKAKVKAALNPGFILEKVSRVKELFRTKRDQVYLVEPVSAKMGESCVFPQVNRLNDLLDYSAEKGNPTRWEFLEEAMRRLESGERSYTWSEGGRLLACAWLGRPKADVTGLPEGAALLQGIYCHPAARDRLGDFLQAVAGRVRQEGHGPVYALAAGRETAIHKCFVEIESREN